MPIIIDDSERSDEPFTVRSPRIRLTVNKACNIINIINIRAKAIYISRRVIDKYSLCLIPGLNIILNAYGSHSALFIDIYENIRFIISPISARYYIFIIEESNIDLILGQPFIYAFYMITSRSNRGFYRIF